tara:strand:+ start:189 stop:476 length:288 start_codon:yes stop_codon:yes gene_type:complete
MELNSINTTKINKKKSGLFLEEPNYIYRVFNKINYYLIGGYNFNNNNSNLFLTIIIILSLIAIYSILYTIIFFHGNYVECRYISPNCNDKKFSYQ